VIFFIKIKINHIFGSVLHLCMFTYFVLKHRELLRFGKIVWEFDKHLKVYAAYKLISLMNPFVALFNEGHSLLHSVSHHQDPATNAVPLKTVAALAPNNENMW